jgi:hypothetical protein
MKKRLEEFFKIRPGMSQKYKFPGTYREFASKIAKSIEPGKENGTLDYAIIEEAKRLLSKEISLEGLEDQLLQYPIISYADHHGLLNYKLLYNSNILYAEIIKSLKQPFVVTFASGSVPMVNKSHPRGFYFKKQKFNFFGEKQSKLPVYLFKGKLKAERKRGVDSFLISYDKDSLTADERKFLEFLFFDCLEIERAARNYEYFSDQLTFLTYKLWKYYFDRSIRESVPDIIYLQSNRIVLDRLVDEIKKEDSLVSMIIFDPKVRRIFLNNFNGVAACWGENMGSQLFWGVIERRKKTRLISLKIDESSNTLKGENFELEIEREAIIEAIKTNKILQTSFFDLLLVTFLEGYLTLGGFNQLDYLPQMQEAHVISLIDYMIAFKEAQIKSLKEIGMTGLVDRFSSYVTDGLVCGLFPFHYDSAIDLIWEHNSTDGKFNGTMDGGLTRADLDKMLDMKVKDMIASAVETMMENV